MKLKGLLSLITFSEKRLQTLMLLKDGPKPFSEIKNYFSATSPEILPRIRELERHHLIVKNSGEYRLTPIGEVVVEHLSPLVNVVSVFDKNLNFWGCHDLEDIPMEFLLRIHELGNYKIIESTSLDLFTPHRELMKNLLKSRVIRGVLPIYHPEHPKVLLDLAKNGTKISIIITNEVFNKMKIENKKELERSINYSNYKIMIYKNKLNLAFVVTNFFLSLGLFLKNGKFDVYHDIVSFDKSAIRWGIELFEHFREKSNLIGKNIKKKG